MNPKDIAQYIDHTQLKPDAGESQIAQLCRETMEYSFYSVCVNSCWAGYCAEALKGSEVKLAVVAGFPLGAMETESKAFEARRAVEAGADEIDMVINVGFLKSGNIRDLAGDIKAVREACDAGFEGSGFRGSDKSSGAVGARNTSEQGVLLKVIIETALLSGDEKIAACKAAVEAGADFVKTSTGFSKGGATAEDVALMRSIVGPDIGVKASGGIRSYMDAVKMIEAGATRLGASSGISIVTGDTGDMYGGMY